MDKAVNEEAKSISEADSETANMDMAISKDEEKGNDINEAPTHNRMVIYRAELSIEVQSLEASIDQIEAKANSLGGYVIESNTYHDGDATLSGMITVRVPQENFQKFLNDTESMAKKVFDRVVNGEDVTEEYVDLESRLKSKRVVEERLLGFMKKAEKTEDLLKISNDLAKVQEEIEQLVGRMKFLENQSSFSTITVSLSEDKIVVPTIDNQELNTWEKTKKQFVSSLNFLLALGSGLIILIAGNIPIILVLTILFFSIFFIVKKVRNERIQHNNLDDE